MARARRSTAGATEAQEPAALPSEHEDAVEDAVMQNGAASEAEEGEDGGEDNDEENEDEDDDDEDESSDGEPVVPLLATREKRANAGNRMRQLIEDEADAKIEVEEMFKEEDNDVDFHGKEEKDEFDSDFGSTDSGSGDDEDENAEDAGERRMQREERDARKDAKKKQRGKTSHTPFLPSFARQTKQSQRQMAQPSTSATTLDGEQNGDLTRPVKRRKKEIDPAFLVQRESSRTSAVAFKERVEGRLKQNQHRKAAAPRTVKKATVSLTQADLIAEALETEEVNRASLLAFYAAEEDRKAADRAAGIRYALWGPRLTFISRVEGGNAEDVAAQAKRAQTQASDKGKAKEIAATATAAATPERGRRRMIEVLGEQGQADWKAGEEEGLAAVKEAVERDGATQARTAEVQQRTERPKRNASAAVKAAIAAEREPDPVETEVKAQEADLLPVARPPALMQQMDADERHARNYISLTEVEEYTPFEQLQAILGEHQETFTPLPALPEDERYPPCAVTGVPRARYRDPETGIAYADARAYATLKDLKAGKFALSAATLAFTGRVDFGLVGDIVKMNEGVRHAARVEAVTATATPQLNPYERSYTTASHPSSTVPPSPSAGVSATARRASRTGRGYLPAESPVTTVGSSTLPPLPALPTLPSRSPSPVSSTGAASQARAPSFKPRFKDDLEESPPDNEDDEGDDGEEYIAGGRASSGKRSRGGRGRGRSRRRSGAARGKKR